MLIEHGADPEARDARGHTALDHARMQGLQSLVNLLENR
jgi:ankyrin repeat protein